MAVLFSKVVENEFLTGTNNSKKALKPPSWKSVLTLSLLAATFVVCRSPLQTVWTQIRTVKMSVLIWIQTVWHSDSVPERIFWKSQFWKNSADDNWMKNYPACNEFNVFGTGILWFERSIDDQNVEVSGGFLSLIYGIMWLKDKIVSIHRYLDLKYNID